ncbi:MAG: hypothetical protein Q4A82_01765 [Corynebacterium sp.]|nr:hypothetical protein [Corynebacterium sp.]
MQKQDQIYAIIAGIAFVILAASAAFIGNVAINWVSAITLVVCLLAIPLRRLFPLAK